MASVYLDCSRFWLHQRLCLHHNNRHSLECHVMWINNSSSGCEIWDQPFQGLGGCFTYVSRALQNILSKFVYCRNSTCDENFKLKLCTCAQIHALGTRTKFQLETLIINVISGVVYFRKIILESWRNVSETTPWDSLISNMTLSKDRIWHIKDTDLGV